MAKENYLNFIPGKATPEWKHLLPRDFDYDVEPYFTSDGQIVLDNGFGGFWNETEYQLRLGGYYD